MERERGFFRRSAEELPRVECEPDGGEAPTLGTGLTGGGDEGGVAAVVVSLCGWRAARTELVCGSAIVVEALHANRFYVMVQVSARRGTLYPHLFDGVEAVELCGVRYRRERSSVSDRAGPGTDGTGRWAVDVTVLRRPDQPVPAARYVPTQEEPESVRLIFAK